MPEVTILQIKKALEFLWQILKMWPHNSQLTLSTGFLPWGRVVWAPHQEGRTVCSWLQKRSLLNLKQRQVMLKTSNVRLYWDNLFITTQNLIFEIGHESYPLHPYAFTFYCCMLLTPHLLSSVLMYLLYCVNDPSEHTTFSIIIVGSGVIITIMLTMTEDIIFSLA